MVSGNEVAFAPKVERNWMTLGNNDHGCPCLYSEEVGTRVCLDLKLRVESDSWFVRDRDLVGRKKEGCLLQFQHQMMEASNVVVEGDSKERWSLG